MVLGTLGLHGSRAFAFLGITKHPDVLLVVPCRLVGLGFVYVVNYVCERFWARLETEVHQMIFGRSTTGMRPAGDPSALHEVVPHGTPFAPMPHQGQAVLPVLGWFCALLAYTRQT